jgi:hypothetical protein
MSSRLLGVLGLRVRPGQVLHVTFGQVLTERGLAEPLLAELRKRPEAYADTLERHFLKHLRPFAAAREEATP